MRSRIEENMARKEESQREKGKAVQIKDSCYFTICPLVQIEIKDQPF
jgi:hypothetical protein